MAAVIVRAVDEQPMNASGAQFSKSDLLGPIHAHHCADQCANEAARDWGFAAKTAKILERRRRIAPKAKCELILSSVCNGYRMNIRWVKVQG